jgi:hypothetical protein
MLTATIAVNVHLAVGPADEMHVIGRREHRLPPPDALAAASTSSLRPTRWPAQAPAPSALR